VLPGNPCRTARPYLRLFLALKGLAASLAILSCLPVALASLVLAGPLPSGHHGCAWGHPLAIVASHSWHASASWEHSSPQCLPRCSTPSLAPALLGRWAPAASCLATPFLAALLRPALDPASPLWPSPALRGRPRWQPLPSSYPQPRCPRPKPGCTVSCRLPVSAPVDPSCLKTPALPRHTSAWVSVSCIAISPYLMHQMSQSQSRSQSYSHSSHGYSYSQNHDSRSQ